MTDRMLKSPAPRCTILIVDDEPQIRALMKRTLEGAGYLVLEADSGATAATVSSKHQGRIDLLITDLIMPRTDGFMTSARLLRARPEMRLLLVSGYAEISPSVRENLDKLKDTPFLAKPHTAAELLEKVCGSLGTSALQFTMKVSSIQSRQPKTPEQAQSRQLITDVSNGLFPGQHVRTVQEAIHSRWCTCQKNPNLADSGGRSD